MVPHASTLSDSLPAHLCRPRPPTPPQDIHNTEESLEGQIRGFPKETTSRASSNFTPDSSAESTIQEITGGTSRKKVNWPDNNETASSPVVEPLPVSGERKPIKSILKPYNGVNSFSPGNSTKLVPPHVYPNLAAMLESIVQQLAADDRSSKMDAYTTLSGSIKASDNVPDLPALKTKLPGLLQFMKRDMTARTSTGSFDTSLIVNDLTLLSSFLAKPDIARNLPTDFCSFVVDHAIKTFENPEMSKDVVKHLMWILARQDFSPKVMAQERVGKLLAAIHDVDSYVTGKSITRTRLDVYKKLIRNSKSHMLSNTEWIKDLFNEMLSSNSDTRAAAITLGLEAALVLGTKNKASRTVMEFFQHEYTTGENENTIKSADYLASRLRELISKKQEGGSAQVPQIWSVVVLFLRCRPRQFEQWAYMNLWLQIIAECFNSSDSQTKLEANMAWNRLIFTIGPDETTSRKLAGILRNPLLDQLKRKNKSANPTKSRKATLSSICFLLYYSLKPDATPTQMDLYWDEYVVQFLGKALTPASVFESPELARRDLMDACDILKALFDSTTPRPWTETRAMEDVTRVVAKESIGDVAMKSIELPALDPKWLRKSFSRVFPILHPILEKLFWDLSDEGASSTGLWKAYITSIASPAAKEVKVSVDTMGCVAGIFDFLFRVWQSGPDSTRHLPASNGSVSQDFLGSFSTIISTTIEGLGLLPFTEKLLSMGTQDTFVVIATPSHRPRNLQEAAQCPLHHLFALLTIACPGLQYDWKFSQLARQILSPFFDARPTSKGQMDLVKDLMQLLPVESTERCKIIWQVLAEFATLAADTRDRNGTSGGTGSIDQPLGVEYRNALRILEVGVELCPHEPLPGWKGLFEALITSSTIDAGDGGRAIAMIEPLARAFIAKSPKDSPLSMPGMNYCRMLVSKATYPKDRLSLDAARRKMWGAVNTGSKTTGFDPYVFLYEYQRWCLESAYGSQTKDRPLDCADLLSATTALLNRCPSSALVNALEKLQAGIGCWILDANSRLTGGNPLSQAVTSLWGRICSQVPQIKHSHSPTKTLNDLELLICSGLESKHRTIVNSSIRLWNSAFGSCEDKLEYPPRLAAALLKLRSIADLRLPFFPESHDESEERFEARQPFDFIESQEETSGNFGSKNLSAILRRNPNQSPYKKFTPQDVLAPAIPSKRPREETPEPGNRKSKKRVSTPRLRHDDSQIQFEAIESSPIANTILDSQPLTDRQKELKERQQTEAAMFPDIRSSPRPKSATTPRESSSISTPKARMLDSVRSGRQTTPTLISQVDYDDYVNSSPTPTRSLHVDEDMLGPPSSPPEQLRRQESPEYPEEPDVPTSPQIIREEPTHGTLTSGDPSAQIDPFALVDDRGISTFEFSSDQQHNLAISHTASDSKPPPSPTKLPEISTSIDITDHSSPAPSSPHVGERETPVPNTPNREYTPTTNQTPKTLVFHDALESPVSSDKQAGSDEIFQDSFSSPHFNIAEPKKSSPLSDLDESSMVRLMSGFDEGSGRPRKNIAADKENQMALEPLASSDVAPQTLASNISHETEKGLETHLDGSRKIHRDLGISSDICEKSSSILSLIPETPGPKPMQTEDEEMVDVDFEQTIIVDIPADFNEVLNRHLLVPAGKHIIPENTPERSPTKRLSPKKRNSTGHGKPRSPAVTKRTLRQISNGGSEVLDSQAVKIERAFLEEMAPPPKKRRGRPRKSGSLTPSQSDMDSQLEFSPRFPSVDLDASRDSITTSDNHPIANALTAKEHSVLRPSIEGLNEAGNELTASEDVMAEKAVQALDIFEGQPEFMQVEIVRETSIDDTSIDDTSSSDKPSSAPNIIEPKAPEAIGVTTGELAQNERPQIDAEVQTEAAEPEALTAKSLAEKLRSLIGDLSRVALTREEVNTFEDIFMDAKEQLYGAGRRGRALSS